MVLAVLEAHGGLKLGQHDVYLNVAGGLRIGEPAADLAAAAALISSLVGVALPHEAVYFGEIALSGAVRAVGHAGLRLKEAAKLGFSQGIRAGGRGQGRGRRAGDAGDVGGVAGGGYCGGGGGEPGGGDEARRGRVKVGLRFVAEFGDVSQFTANANWGRGLPIARHRRRRNPLPPPSGEAYHSSMTDLLERAVAAARGLPPAAQDDIARIVLQLAGEDAAPVLLTGEERSAIARSKAAVAQGEFATDEEVRAVWAKHGL